MRRLRRVIRALASRQEGISISEYGLPIAGVALALVVVVSTAGAAIRGFVGRASCAVYSTTCGGSANAGGPAAAPTPRGTGANGGGGNDTGTNPNGTENDGGSRNSGGARR